MRPPDWAARYLRPGPGGRPRQPRGEEDRGLRQVEDQDCPARGHGPRHSAQAGIGERGMGENLFFGVFFASHYTLCQIGKRICAGHCVDKILGTWDRVILQMCDFTKQSFDLNKIFQFQSLSTSSPYYPAPGGVCSTTRAGRAAWPASTGGGRCRAAGARLYCTVLYCTVLYRGETAPNMISGLSYNICLRQESGHCAVEWSTVSPHNGGLNCPGEYSIEMCFAHRYR